MNLYQTIGNDLSQFKRDLIAIADFSGNYTQSQLIDAISETFNEHENIIIDSLSDYFEIYNFRGHETNIPNEIESALNDFDFQSDFEPDKRQIYFDELRERVYNFFDNLQGN